MEDFVKLLSSCNGDVIHITLSEDNMIFSTDTIRQMGDVKLVGVDLRRLAGTQPVGHDMLGAIGMIIADYFLMHSDVMVFYYCDFINPIPHTHKDIPCQEYRSNLFKLMFERYVRQHDINDVHLSVITAQGIEETFYFHLIYRDEHAFLVSVISQDIREGYDK